MKTLTILSLIAATAIAGCATPPDQIAATYVSPNAFADLSCPAPRAETGNYAHSWRTMARLATDRMVP